jgi:adenosine deaminase
MTFRNGGIHSATLIATHAGGTIPALQEEGLVFEIASLRRGLFSSSVALLLVSFSFAQRNTTAEQRTARYMESLRQKPPLLLAFLREMPKGGDLHNHLSGAIYAESWIDFAAEDGLCVDHTTSFLIAPPCDPCEKYANKPAIACAYKDHVLYNQIIDAWSMRNWNRGEESGHDHFFATFDKFLLATFNHVGEELAEAASRAADNHLQYLELMHTADGMEAANLGSKLGWNENFGQMREKLLGGGLREVVVQTRAKLNADEAKMRSTSKCGTQAASAGCRVQVRYLYQVLRGLARESVFAQMLLGFELATAEPRFVGLNLVMPEDWYVPKHDFDLHMRMLDYLHGVYPKVHISLHAGELAPGLVPPEGLRFHIRASIERGHAERIGHGVSVMYETRPVELLKEMAKRNVQVEICLTSNDVILGVRDEDHPFGIYGKYGVPVALATDDQGVSRSDITTEFLRAAQTYKLSYLELKTLARTSLEHSFLPGASLWADAHALRRVNACAADTTSRATNAGCKRFLEGSERARAQWELETEFAHFEKQF